MCYICPLMPIVGCCSDGGGLVTGKSAEGGAVDGCGVIRKFFPAWNIDRPIIGRHGNAFRVPKCRFFGKLPDPELYASLVYSGNGVGPWGSYFWG